MKKILLVCFVLAIVIRVFSVFPYITIIGFDQARDLLDAYTMIQSKHLRIIGPTAGNNPNLHHGIAFIYYLAAPILFFGPNPMYAVYFNIFIQSTLVFILAYLSWSLFKNKEVSITTAVMTACSYTLTQFSGWLSNPTVTLFTVPIFYLALWKYRSNKKWLVVAALALGATIEFELFFIYLIPVFIIYWLLFKPNLPSLKIFFISIFSFAITTSSMIVTEFKYSFSGIKSILEAGQSVGGSLPFWDRLHFFSKELSDQLSLSLAPIFPSIITVFVCAFIYYKTKERKSREALIFLYLYVASPAVMLALGAHNAPWFLIGLPPAIIILYSYLLPKLKVFGYFIIVCLLIISFIKISINIKNGQRLLEPDEAAILSRQISAIDYTYKNSNGKPFSLNTVTNPLYINAIWAYNYLWYGKEKYGYMPTWLGGDQIKPYNTLDKEKGYEEYLFLITDDTSRIPLTYREEAKESMNKIGKLVEKVDFDEIRVRKYERIK